MKIDETTNCVIARFTGRTGFQDLDEVRVAIENSPQFRPGLNRIWDERDAIIETSADDLKALATNWNASSVNHGKRKIAYLVDESLHWGFNRQFESLRNSPDAEFGIFTNFDELRGFLELPIEFPDPRELF